MKTRLGRLFTRALLGLVIVIYFCGSVVGQFNYPYGINDVLNTITGSLGPSVGSINGSFSSIQNTEQTIVFPPAVMAMTQGNIKSIVNSYRGWMAQVYTQPLSSAQVPSNSQFEHHHSDDYNHVSECVWGWSNIQFSCAANDSTNCRHERRPCHFGAFVGDGNGPECKQSHHYGQSDRRPELGNGSRYRRPVERTGHGIAASKSFGPTPASCLTAAPRGWTSRTEVFRYETICYKYSRHE